jgi:hypothetical protein
MRASASARCSASAERSRTRPTSDRCSAVSASSARFSAESKGAEPGRFDCDEPEPSASAPFVGAGPEGDGGSSASLGGSFLPKAAEAAMVRSSVCAAAPVGSGVLRFCALHGQAEFQSVNQTFYPPGFTCTRQASKQASKLAHVDAAERLREKVRGVSSQHQQAGQAEFISSNQSVSFVAVPARSPVSSHHVSLIRGVVYVY